MSSTYTILHYSWSFLPLSMFLRALIALIPYSFSYDLVPRSNFCMTDTTFRVGCNLLTVSEVQFAESYLELLVYHKEQNGAGTTHAVHSTPFFLQLFPECWTPTLKKCSKTTATKYFSYDFSAASAHSGHKDKRSVLVRCHLLSQHQILRERSFLHGFMLCCRLLQEN